LGAQLSAISGLLQLSGTGFLQKTLGASNKIEQLNSTPLLRDRE